MQQAGEHGGSREDKICARKAGDLEDKHRAGKIGCQPGAPEDKRHAGQAGTPEDKRCAGQAGAPEDKQRPRSAPVLASAPPGASLRHDFMTLRPFHGMYRVLPFFEFSGFSRLLCPLALPLSEL